MFCHNHKDSIQLDSYIALSELTAFHPTCVGIEVKRIERKRAKNKVSNELFGRILETREEFIAVDDVVYVRNGWSTKKGEKSTANKREDR